jgi:hypothetical protein
MVVLFTAGDIPAQAYAHDHTRSQNYRHEAEMP